MAHLVWAWYTLRPAQSQPHLGWVSTALPQAAQLASMRPRNGQKLYFTHFFRINTSNVNLKNIEVYEKLILLYFYIQYSSLQTCKSALSSVEGTSGVGGTSEVLVSMGSSLTAAAAGSVSPSVGSSLTGVAPPV